jgi:UDP-3-O-[3-hydroxymyristoyl] glucosamine N-acyltransferase
MKFSEPISVQSLAHNINAEIIGDDGLILSGINEIHKVERGDITFVDNPKYFNKSVKSNASAILINFRAECPPGKALLVCENPFHVFDEIVKKLRPTYPLSEQVSESALIHPSSVLEPLATIGNHVVIGKNCFIKANTYIGDYTLIGDNVVIQPGALIGCDAFYFHNEPKGRTKWHSGGRVIIKNDVEIGAGCTISKGVTGDTIIGEGTKIDCQVHIGHGVVIGKNCLIAGQVGIGGKAIIEDDVVLYGQVGVAQRVKIGKGAVVSAKSGVSKNLPGGKLYFGIPAAEIRTRQRELAALRELPDFFRNNPGKD